MYDVFKQKLQEQLEAFLETGKLTGKQKIYFFGINDSCRETITYLREKNLEVLGILENNTSKQGTYCCGVRAVSVKAGIGNRHSDKVVIISSPYWREMKEQLLSLGMSEEQILVLFVFFDEIPWKPYFREPMKLVMQGRDIYRNLEKRYSPDYHFLLCPYTGTGDVYLVGTLLPAYLRKNGIEKYVLVVISASCRKVAKIFDIPYIHQLEGMDDVTCLLRYYMLCPEETKLKVLNDSWADIYTCLTQWVRGLHGMDFTQMFTRFVFELGEKARPEQPVLKERREEVDVVFEESGMVPGRTVVIAPYTTTLSELPNEFWEKLAKSLTERGYMVFTNSGGPGEPVIDGTDAAFFPLEIAPQAMSRAGGFVGVRSGFCDVISGSTAKKVVLYDKHATFYNCSAYEYFSLEKMGLCDDAVEIEYDNKDYLDVLDVVLREFPKLAEVQKC